MQSSEKPLISIIVPVHNAGKYLHRCLSSLVNQTLHNIEIILILDCPTDGSDVVAEEFASKDCRIKILYNDENLHTGLSRNKGLDLAQGEYIGFMDHDDYCEINMYELLYNAVKDDKVDICRCNFYCGYTTNEGKSLEKYVYPIKTSQIQDKDWIYEYVCGDKVSCVIWNHIYKSDFLKSNKIQFLDSRNICSEDSIFFMEVYLKVENLQTIPEYMYYHVFHTSNTGKNYVYRSVENRISFFEKLFFLLKSAGVDNNTCFRYLAVNLMKSLYSGVRQTLKNTSIGNVYAKIKMLKTNDLVQSNISYLSEKENKQEKNKLKPTILFLMLFLKN